MPEDTYKDTNSLGEQTIIDRIGKCVLKAMQSEIHSVKIGL